MCSEAECCYNTCGNHDVAAVEALRGKCSKAAAAAGGTAVHGFAEWKLCSTDVSSCDSAAHCCATAAAGPDLLGSMAGLRFTLVGLTPDLAAEIEASTSSAETFFRLVEDGLRAVHRQPEVLLPLLDEDTSTPTAFMMQEASLLSVSADQSRVVRAWPVVDGGSRNLLQRARKRGVLPRETPRALTGTDETYALEVSSYFVYLDAVSIANLSGSGTLQDL